MRAIDNLSSFLLDVYRLYKVTATSVNVAAKILLKSLASFGRVNGITPRAYVPSMEKPKDLGDD